MGCGFIFSQNEGQFYSLKISALASFLLNVGMPTKCLYTYYTHEERLCENFYVFFFFPIDSEVCLN